MHNEELNDMVKKLKASKDKANMTLFEYRNLIKNIRQAKANLMKQYELYYELEKAVTVKAVQDGHAKM
jgi:hypothetical protein